MGIISPKLRASARGQTCTMQVTRSKTAIDAATLEPDLVDPPAPELTGREAAIVEAAFQMYWRFIRMPDERTARQRFARLKIEQREIWEGDAKAAFRVFETYSKGAME